MPINFNIDHERRRVTARVEGEIKVDDIETFLDAVVVADALPYRKLFDGRTAFGKYTDEELMRLAARMSAYATLGPRGAVAIVPSREYFELAQRFANLDKPDHPLRIFLDIDEAERWLKTQNDL